MKKQTFSVFILSICVLAMPESSLAQVPASVLLDQISDEAGYVYQSVDAENGTDSKIDNYWASETFEKSKKCVADIDKVYAAGIAATRAVRVRDLKLVDGDRSRPMPLSEVRSMCGKMAALSGKKVYKVSVGQDAMSTSTFLKLLSDGQLDEVQAKYAFEMSTKALANIEAARAAGMADSDEIEVFDTHPTLAEVKEKIGYLHDESQKIFAKNKAAEEAQYEPFRKALSGDKLALYNSRMKSYKVYGVGGRVLKTPEDYASSPLWCDSGVDRNGIVPMWEVACWHFRGMAKLGDVVTRSGAGESAPSSAYH